MKYIQGILGGFLLLVTICWIKPGLFSIRDDSIWSKRTPRAATLSNMNRISAAIQKYSKEHTGHLPLKLSDLVPHYLNKEHYDIFFFPEGDPRESHMPITQNLALEYIDMHGAYTYINGNDSDGSMVMYESSAYNKNRDYLLGRAYLLNDFSVRFCSESEFQDMLAK